MKSAGTCVQAASPAFIRRARGISTSPANTPHFWQALCRKTDLDALSADPRFDTVRKRALHVNEIVPQLHAALQAKSALEWEALFGEDVLCAAARTVEDMFDDPQVPEDMIATYEHPVVGRYRGLKRSIRFGRTPGPEPFAAPTFGQDSEQVLSEQGMSGEDIEALRAKRVIEETRIKQAKEGDTSCPQSPRRHRLPAMCICMSTTPAIRTAASW